MSVFWDHILSRLNSFPAGVNNLLPPCPEARLTAVKRELGQIPVVVAEMLRRFNGGKLFNKTGPMIHLFGITLDPPLSSLEWGEDWYIDKFTPRWRSAGSARENDWAVAMTNYGGLIIVNPDGRTRQWDTARSAWEAKNWTFHKWFEECLQQGVLFMAEK